MVEQVVDIVLKAVVEFLSKEEIRATSINELLIENSYKNNN